MISHWLGWISLSCCSLLICKYPARKTKIKKLNGILRKLHIPIASLLLTTGIIHGVITFIKVPYRSISILSGLALLILLSLVSASYYFRKTLKKKWMTFHRVGTIVVIPLLIFHIVISTI